MATELRAPSYRTGSEPNRFCEKRLPSTKSGIASTYWNGWPMSANSRDAKARRLNSVRRQNEVSQQPESPDKRSGEMSHARAGAGRSSRSAAALETFVPATASHTHARRFRTDPSTPRKLNLRKLVRGGGINRGGLHDTSQN